MSTLINSTLLNKFILTYDRQILRNSSQVVNDDFLHF